MTWSARRTEMVGELFDHLAAHPKGMTCVEMGEALHVTPQTAKGRVRDLRLLLADDTITVPCAPVKPNKPWVYRLVGTHEESRFWLNNRARDLETRIETQHAVARSLVNASDAKTVSGRRVRHIETALRHLIEDLELMG